MAFKNSNPAYTLDSARNIPNSSAARAMRVGFHWPKIMTARDRKPKPATPYSNRHSETPAVMNTIPPRPPSTPEMSTPAQRILYTLMPTELAAWGCSPQAMSRRPKRVLYSST